MKVTDFVYNPNVAFFRRYRAGYMYYEISGKGSTDIYEFPISIKDVEGATLLDMEKAINLMRWIRQAIEDKTLVKVSNGEELTKSPVELKDK